MIEMVFIFQLVVFDNYSEPADLRADILALEAEDPVYAFPLDDRGTAPPLPSEEEDVYSLPCDSPLPCRTQGKLTHLCLLFIVSTEQ